MCNDQLLQITPQVLMDAMQMEANSIEAYQQLQQMAGNDPDVQQVQVLLADSTAHMQALANLFRQWTGTNPPPVRAQPQQLPSYREGVRKLLPDALRESEYYRCIALQCQNMAPRLFFDLMADKNKHAALLNYLYIKTFEGCCQQEPEPAPCEGIAHAVQAGESLWQIGQRYAVTLEDLLAANPQVTNPENIYVGQILCIPCAGSTYVVQAGDSLWSIAQRHGLSVAELQSSNPLIAAPDSIYPGQALCIPCCTGGPAPAAGRESLTYLYGGTSNDYLNAIAATRDSLCTVCPDFFEIDQNGNLLLAAANKLNAPFIDELHRQGLFVTPFITNHWNREAGAAALANRENLASQLASVVQQYNLDGVNFDIENLTEQHRAAYVELVRLLREKLPEEKIVSVAVAANPNGWDTGWHGSYDYRGLAGYCDYLVVMAYDESYQGGPEGPVSSSAFFERSIQYALSLGIPKEKIVVGIPFFGRYWKQGEAAGGIGLADRDIEYLIANYTSAVRYDEATQSAFAVVTILPGQPEPSIWGGRKMTAGTYHIWYDNLPATRYKLEMIRQYDVRGAASWSLGQENPAVWDFYTQALTGSDGAFQVPQPL